MAGKQVCMSLPLQTWIFCQGDIISLASAHAWGISMLSEIACRPIMVTHREEATTGEEKERLGALASQLTALREGLGASTCIPDTKFPFP